MLPVTKIVLDLGVFFFFLLINTSQAGKMCPCSVAAITYKIKAKLLSKMHCALHDSVYPPASPSSLFLELDPQ